MTASPELRTVLKGEEMAEKVEVKSTIYFSHEANRVLAPLGFKLRDYAMPDFGAVIRPSKRPHLYIDELTREEAERQMKISEARPNVSRLLQTQRAGTPIVQKDLLNIAEFSAPFSDDLSGGVDIYGTPSPPFTRVMIKSELTDSTSAHERPFSFTELPDGEYNICEKIGEGIRREIMSR